MRTFVLSFDPGIAAAGLQADCESPEKADEQIHQGGADGGRELAETPPATQGREQEQQGGPQQLAGPERGEGHQADVQGGRYQGRSRGPWSLLGGVGGQSWDLLERIVDHLLCIRAHP